MKVYYKHILIEEVSSSSIFILLIKIWIILYCIIGAVTGYILGVISRRKGKRSTFTTWKQLDEYTWITLWKHHTVTVSKVFCYTDFYELFVDEKKVYSGNLAGLISYLGKYNIEWK